MAENKKSVLLYCDIINTVEALTDKEAGKLFKHYLRYVNDLDPVAPDKITQIVFEPIKQDLKRDLLKWKLKCEKNSEIAKEGWEKRKGANASERIKPDAKHADTDKDNDTDNDKEVLWSQTQKDFFNCYHWIEKFSRDKNVRPDELKRQMELFITDVDLSNQIKDLKELQSHFLHSFNKGKYKKVEVTDKDQTVLAGVHDKFRQAQAANK